METHICNMRTWSRSISIFLDIQKNIRRQYPIHQKQFGRIAGVKRGIIIHNDHEGNKQSQLRLRF